MVSYAAMFVKACIVVLLCICFSLTDQFTGSDTKTTADLVTESGYPFEKHEVITEDGFILQLHRIVNTNKKVVLLHHCLLCSSADWVANKPNQSLGYLLWDKGYDVWMTNARGNSYSRNHIKLTPEQRQFWDFSMDDISTYDLPSAIDYILEGTNEDKLSYVGFSMGTMIAFGMLSDKPQYNDKIDIFIAIAPVFYIGHGKGPLLDHLSRHFYILEGILTKMGSYEILSGGSFFDSIISVMCPLSWPFIGPICDHILLKSIGLDTSLLGEGMLPELLQQTPAGTSVKNIAHFMQAKQYGKIRKFDYGVDGNMEIYGTEEPPEYSLANTKMPVAIFSAPNDWFSSPQDIQLTANELPNVVFNKQINHQQFSHLDFVWSHFAANLVYADIFDVLSKHSQSIPNCVS